MGDEYKYDIKNAKGKCYDNIEKKEQLSFTKDEDFIQKSLQEKLKDLKEVEKYFRENNPKFIENFELLDYRDSGGESNVYTVIPIFQKEKNINKAIIKVLLNNSKKDMQDMEV